MFQQHQIQVQQKHMALKHVELHIMLEDSEGGGCEIEIVSDVGAQACLGVSLTIVDLLASLCDDSLELCGAHKEATLVRNFAPHDASVIDRTALQT